MAKWDERDPRWLVQNREDGKNVGGWHWEERNVMAWAKQQLEELLTAIPPAAAGGLRIERLKSCGGEASITTRKGGKKLAIWDLTFSVEWSATPEGEDKKPVKGAIEVREFASAHDEEDFLFEITAEGSSADGDAFKAAAAGLKPQILVALAEFGERIHALERP
ncbi:MAG: activator of Hsp90 ATPase [Monoraphidium minutum]|nr:MAG: activator of Hsp90 ATPase [Monoraphidium minutum]